MRKRLLLSVSAIVAIALTAVMNFKAWSPKPTAQELLLNENIEALTNGESEKKSLDCYNTITSKKGNQVRYCPTCTFIPGTSVLFAPSNTCLGYE